MGVLVTSLPPVVMLAVSLLNGRGIALGEAATSPTAPIAHAHALRLLHPGPGVAVRAEALARGIEPGAGNTGSSAGGALQEFLKLVLMQVLAILILGARL